MTLEEAKALPVHLHTSDERFCGEKSAPRSITFDDDKVTCRDCRIHMDNAITAAEYPEPDSDKDATYHLTPAGMQSLRELGYVDAAGNVH